MSDSLEFPFQDSVGGEYRAEEHLLGEGAQRLFLARRAQHPDERYLMAVDWYQDADLDSIGRALAYRIPGVFELATIGRFDELGVNARRDSERRAYWAMLEKLPAGRWLPHALAGQPHSAAAAVSMGRTTGAILKSAAEAGVLLTGVRPEYIWASATPGTIDVTGLSARGQAFFALTRPRSLPTAPLFDRLYIAPEVYRGDPADDRALSFTLALLVAEWATGHYPFPDAWAAGPKASLFTGAHVALAVPPALEALLSRSLQPQPGQRPRLGELLDELRAVPLDEPPRRL